jgi:hypothetical protein
MSISINGIKFYSIRRNKLFGFFYSLSEGILSALLVITLASNLLFPQRVEAVSSGISSILSYQGRLTDASGNALTGTYCVRFSLYDDSVVGAPDVKLWPAGTPTSNSVTVTNGIFDIGVGVADSLSSFDFDANLTPYLNIEVNVTPTTCSGSWENLGPRQRVDAVGYARSAYNLYGGQARLGTGAGAGSGSEKLLKLDIVNVAENVGDNCATLGSGVLWYNSNKSRAYVCENNLVQEIGNKATIVGIQEASAGSAISSGTVQFSGVNGVSVSQNGQTLSVSGLNAAGVSNIGNTAGTSGTKTGTIVFSGNNNITLSQSTGAGGVHTIGISAANQTVQTQNLHNLTISSNTAGVGAAISSGTLTLAGGANITLSQNAGNAITIIGGAGGAAGSNSFGMSNLGNTSGTSGTINGSAVALYFAGGNNITLSQSINASSATITISGGAGGAAGSNTFGMSNLGNTSGTSGTINGSAAQLLFAGGPNITLSQSINGSSATISISAAAGGGVAGTFGMSNLGNTAGTSGVVSASPPQILFAGGPNITLSQSLGTGASTNFATISISGANPGGGAAPTLNLWQNMVAFNSTTNLGTSNATLRLSPLDRDDPVFPGNMTVSSVFLNVSMSGSVTASHTVSASIGLYVPNTGANASILSLVLSASTSFGTGAANANITSQYNGARFLTLRGTQFQPGSNLTLSQTKYILAVWFRSSGSAQNISLIGANFLTTNQRSGTVGTSVATATSMGWTPYYGLYSASVTTAMPTALSMNQIVKVSAGANFIPFIIFNNQYSNF